MSTEDGVPLALLPENEPNEEPTALEDRRSSFRMLTETQALLRIKRRDIVVEMGDQSRGGFRVWMTQTPSFQVNATAILGTPRGWSCVRVAYIDEIEGRYRIGLEFVADLDDPRDVRFRRGSGNRWVHSNGGTDWVYFFGILALASLVAFAVMLHALFPNLELWDHLGRFGLRMRQMLRF